MTATGNIEISASLEDYLETIFKLIKEKQVARSKDVAQRLSVKRSSVTGALQALAERELVDYEPYAAITLTEKGHELALAIAQRHALLYDFFKRALGLADDVADDLACKLEHVLPDSIVKRLSRFVQFAAECPRGVLRWDAAQGFLREYPVAGICEQCSSEGSEVTTTVPEQQEARLTLAEIKPGNQVRVVKLVGGGTLRRRLLDMGVTKGTLIKVERVAPLGDPLEIKLKGYSLTLRKEEAQNVEVAYEA